MSIIKKMRKQRAVWWKRLAADRFGVATWDQPIEVRCRWEDINETYIGTKGEQLGCRAQVYVDREMTPGDRLQLGQIDSNTPDSPLSSTTAIEIKRFDKLPDFRNRNVLYTAYL